MAGPEADLAEPPAPAQSRAEAILHEARAARIKAASPAEAAEWDKTVAAAEAALAREDDAASASTPEMGYGEAALHLGGEALIPFMHRLLMPLGAGLGSLAAKRTFREGWDEEREDQTRALRKARREHPVMDMGAQVGAMALPFGVASRAAQGVRGAVGVGKGLMGRAASRAAQGAAQGAMQGAITSAGEGRPDSETMGAALRGAGAGAVGGAVGGRGGKWWTAPALGAAGGAAADATGSALAGQNPLDNKIPTPIGDLPSMLINALLGAGLSTPAKARAAIRDPKTLQGQAIGQFEAIGGKLRPVRGPKLPPEVADKYGPRPVAEAANSAAGETLKRNYKQDVDDYNKYRAEEEALDARPDQPVAPDEARASLASAVEEQIAKGKASQGDAYPDSTRASLEKWRKFLNSAGTRTHDVDVLPPETPPPRKQLGQTGVDAEFTTKPTDDLSGPKREYRPDHLLPAKETAASEYFPSSTEPHSPRTTDAETPSKTTATENIPRVLTARDLTEMVRELREAGKAGQAAGRSAQPYKKLAGQAREILGEVDPEGHGDRMEREGKQLTDAETRNDMLGLQEKARLKPNRQRREAVAGRLASLGGDDTRVAARNESVDLAASLSPAVRERLPEIRGLQAYEHLRLLGEPLSVGLYGGKMGESGRLRMMLKDLPTKAGGRLDPAIEMGERLRLAPSLLIESIREGQKKKTQEEDEADLPRARVVGGKNE